MARKRPNELPGAFSATPAAKPRRVTPPPVVAAPPIVVAQPEPAPPMQVQSEPEPEPVLEPEHEFAEELTVEEDPIAETEPATPSAKKKSKRRR